MQTKSQTKPTTFEVAKWDPEECIRQVKRRSTCKPSVIVTCGQFEDAERVCQRLNNELELRGVPERLWYWVRVVEGEPKDISYDDPQLSRS